MQREQDAYSYIDGYETIAALCMKLHSLVMLDFDSRADADWVRSEYGTESTDWEDLG